MNDLSKTIMKHNIVAIFCIFLFIALDRITKNLAIKHLVEKPYNLIPGVFQLHYLENRGAAFGILQNQKIFFVLTGIIITAAIFFLYEKMPFQKKYLPLRIVAVFMIAGAIGNMIDRVEYNYVVDFLYFNLIDFPIFNVADCYVTISAFCLILLFLFYYKEEDLAFLTLKKKSITGEEHED